VVREQVSLLIIPRLTSVVQPRSETATGFSAVVPVLEHDPMLELYRLPGCPYCAKVERKLDELGLEYESHNVLPFKFLRFEVRSVSGQSGVPVLVDPEHGVEGMAESDEIVNYLDATYA
jgi:glutaredoxin 3